MNKRDRISDAWVHLFTTFHEGDQVFIIDEDDNYWWGTFKPSMTACIVDGREFNWDKIVFIGHDGFPVKFLKTGVCPHWFETNRGSMRDEIKYQYRLKYPPRTYYIGDPIELYSDSSKLFNWGWGLNDEFIELKTDDGAIGLLYDLDNILAVEAA